MITERFPNEVPIGPALRAVRVASGLTLRQLGTASGVSHQHLARVESGERDLSADLLRRVIRALAQRLHEGAAA